jgi:hypothetical protein
MDVSATTVSNRPANLFHTASIRAVVTRGFPLLLIRSGRLSTWVYRCNTACTMWSPKSPRYLQHVIKIHVCTCTYQYVLYVRVHTEMYAYILLYSLYDRYVPVHTITYTYSHHIIRVLPHGLGEWSTSSVYTLVRNHAIVYDDVNRLVLSCTGPFQVYRILRDLENHVWCTGMNWYVPVLWRFMAVYSGILKISLRILYTWNGPVQDGTRRFTSSYTIAWFRTRVYTEDVLLFPMQWISPS